MRRPWNLALVVLVPLFLLAAQAPREEKPRIEGQKLSPEARRELAGSYFLGDGLGVNLRLTIFSEGGYSYSWRGCLGLYASGGGDVLLHEGNLIFDKLEYGPKDDRKMERLRPVRWGERLYLVRPEEMLDFIDAIHKKIEPRDESFGLFYLRDGDWARPVSGRPDLPEIYRGHLLESPVETVILRELDDFQFEIGAGRRQGLRRGLGLSVLEDAENAGYCKIIVIAVEEDTAVVQAGEGCLNLRPNHRVTTGSPWEE